jgi:hypothetical protein
VYLEVVLTEDGPYLKDNLPDDYGGSELEVKMPLSLMFADTDGSISQLDFPDHKDVQDKDSNTGIGWEYELRGATFNLDPVTGVTLVATAVVEYYDDLFTESELSKIEYFIERSLKDRDKLPEI